MPENIVEYPGFMIEWTYFYIKRNKDLTSAPTILARSEHNISRANIDQNALKVLYRLKDAGFDAYLVGGGVRDLLLGLQPKDFDIATNARPEEIKQVFRNCRLVGRRFRLAHIYFGREMIEVATFRGKPSDDDDAHHTKDNGRILRDNVYGTLEEDAWRRDFTINALYYNIRDFSVVDYTGGLESLEKGELKLIGDPEQRYREDPVRMLRAVRLSVKASLRIHTESEAPIADLGYLLDDIPPARLFDEVLKLFMGGMAIQTFEQLRHYDLFGYLFPETNRLLDIELEGFPKRFLTQAFVNTDARIAEGKPVTPAFIFATLLWDPLLDQKDIFQQQGMSEVEAFQAAAAEVIKPHAINVTLPKRFGIPMREIWQLQPRLMKNNGRRTLRLLTHPRFRAAYDFLLLRAQAGEDVGEVAQWWTDFQELDDEQRNQLVKSTAPKRKKRSRSKRRRIRDMNEQ